MGPLSTKSLPNNFVPLRDKELHSDSLFVRRWHNLFGPRIQVAINNNSNFVPTLFPGAAPALDVIDNLPVSNFDAPASGQLYYDQFRRISTFQKLSNRKSIKWRTVPFFSVEPWVWRYVEHPHLMQVTLEEHTKDITFESQMTDKLDTLWNLLKNVHLINSADPVAATNRLCKAIHTLWSNTASQPYEETHLHTASEVLFRQTLNNKTVSLLPLLFELEAFLTYCTTIKQIQPLTFELFGSCWLDIGTMSLQNLRATEQCQSAQLFKAILNIANGNSAPIIVNEYGCVADGNHRLIAAWIWNILAECQSYKWSLSDDEFQEAISKCVRSAQINPVVMQQALHHLGFYLDNELCRRLLIDNLQRMPQMSHIEELPVVPMMEYSTIALVGKNYDQSKKHIQFDPNTYELLSKNNNMVLAAKACYHFADTVPLPQFSFIQNAKGEGSWHKITVFTK